MGKGTTNDHSSLAWDPKEIYQTHFCSLLLSCLIGNAVIDAYSEPVPYFWVKKPGVWGSLGETSHPSVLTRKLKVEKSCKIKSRKEL